MPAPLIECIPNFSEGRRRDVIDRIVEAISRADAIKLLDVSSDRDHNRTVVTFAGVPEAVERAAFAGIKMAAQLIDLDVHRGQHPRIGATDVVPFVPLQDVTMDDCVKLAKRLGLRVGTELSIPVYLYESAATQPSRQSLEDIRRGEYEGLREAIKTDPARMPDFGPAELGSAGATVIGARPALVAFNVYLTTDNVEIASRIAKAVRHSSGGFRFVKALGLLVEGKAQVSMNLTNFGKTPIFRVVETIRREAQRYGVGIAHTELVGLVPQDALIETAQWYVQLDGFSTDQLLERRLQSIPYSGPSVSEPPIPEGATTMAEPPPATPAKTVMAFLDDVAAGTATPGGGAVSAFAGALAASLAAMVARLTVGRQKYIAVQTQMQEVVNQTEILREHLLDAVDEDGRAFLAYMDARRLDAQDTGRDTAIQGALRHATESPLRVMRLALEAMHAARTVTELGNVNASTDSAVAAHMALAAVEGSALNVRINAIDLQDRDLAAGYIDETTRMILEARALNGEIIALAESRAGLR